METKKDPRGRKPIKDKKRCVRFYLYDSTIKLFGDEDLLKAKIYAFIERKTKKDAV